MYQLLVWRVENPLKYIFKSLISNIDNSILYLVIYSAIPQLSSPFEAFALPKLPSHSILLVIRGKVKVTSDQIELVISRGKSIFVKSQYEMTLSPVIGEGNGGGNDDYVLIFRAFSTG